MNWIEWFDNKSFEANRIFEIKQAQAVEDWGKAAQSKIDFINSLLEQAILTDEKDKEIRIKILNCGNQEANEIINYLLDSQIITNPAKQFIEYFNREFEFKPTRLSN